MGDETEDLVKQVQQLSPKFDEAFLQLGRVLSKLQVEDLQTFKGAVKAANLGSRKAYYLLEIDRAFRDLDVTDEQLMEVGWTKLGMLAKKVNPHNVDMLLDKASGLTARQLADLLKGLEPKGAARTVMLSFTPDEYEKLDITLRHFGAQRSGRGLVDKEKAIMALVDWYDAHKG